MILVERLIDEAVKWAAAVEPGCHSAYAFAKHALQATTMRPSMTHVASTSTSSRKLTLTDPAAFARMLDVIAS